MEIVDIIASGYEFQCPACSEFTTLEPCLSDIDHIVECEHCKEKFETGEAKHCE